MPIVRFPSFSGTMRPGPYALTAPLLLLTPHLVVALLMIARGTPLIADVGFWLLAAAAKTIGHESWPSCR
ncbi:hypothetical protein [Sphingomonas sp. Leaf21]|uniref:hypothetical protein n=1 Tax=Sphingomonas sp. Leaf21 TaxID=2876550 RepID=UPI001E46B6AA|nr:hypothetical protein [Sphingomonas sp. Leaf21]